MPRSRSNELSSGIEFIALIVGLFCIAKVLGQMLTDGPQNVKPIFSLRRWWPWKEELKEAARPATVGTAIGTGWASSPPLVGTSLASSAGTRPGRCREAPEKFGTRCVGGVAASDSASSATLGGALTTTLALGIPGTPSWP